MNKKILVTGGAGFIGSHLCDELTKNGNFVVSLDNLLTGKKENIKQNFEKENFVFVEGDANTKDLEKVFHKFNGFDQVFHYAAVIGVKRTLENPFSVLDDIEGIKLIGDLSVHYKVKKLCMSSSSEVYGESNQPFQKEDSFVNPPQLYGIVKLFGEKCLETHYKKNGLETLSLRFFNVYGPRQESSDYGFVTGIFLEQALNGQDHTIFGDGTQTRDFVYIKDNLAATLYAMESDKTNGGVYNVGTGVSTKILDLSQKIIDLNGNQNITQEFLERRIDILHRLADVTKLQKLGWHPNYTLDKGLRETFNYYKNGKSRDIL